MRSTICHKTLHLVFFNLTVLLVWLKITATTPDEGVGDYKCIDKEIDALLHFKSYIRHDPYGVLSTWTRNEKEEAIDDCCEWVGVQCDNHSRVTTLYLNNGYLEGNISPSLLNLSYLTELQLDSNSFSGTIPTFIGSMTQLEFLNLGHNDFSGSVPLELGNLTNLQNLLLNYMGSCTIENLDWLSHLSGLEGLDMSGISLAKVDNWVDVILSLRKLTFLDLSTCDLSQVMHPYSYSSINSSLFIGILRLKENNLNSSMYRWLFPLISNNLERLDLSGNKLDGIPEYFRNLSSLVSLYFENNSMSTKFTNLLDNLSGSALTLTELDISNSQFSGSISDVIQKFSFLNNLYLSNNQLNGTISEKVWQLPNLQFLDLSSNSLKGDICKNIVVSEQIEVIDLSNNSFEGVPSKCGMANLPPMKIDLSSNNFYGPIPNVSSGVVWLDLSNNKFNGRISFLCQLAYSSLVLLDLSNNSLTGEIPDCLWNFQVLKVLNLGLNKLSGRLPASMKYLIDLQTLYVYNNNFFGEFPLSLKNCRNLIFLELGANNFSGHVPLWIGEELLGLYALSLSSNNFSGTIPLQLCQLVNLTILDFSSNNLYGTIPSCLNYISSMVQDGFPTQPTVRSFPFSRDLFEGRYVDHAIIKWKGSAREFSSTLGLVKSIDLSHNNLSGNIPNELTDLRELIALNLSMNALHGEIPSKIGLMKHLLQLDLSRNHLSERIPTSMSHMTSLDYLDVSYNNLSGRIPSSTQLQSFEPSRYTGNVGLCGLPLFKQCPGDKELEVPLISGESDDEEGIDDLERLFYVGGSIGFSMGFWTICSGLLLYPRGRHAFFGFMNSLEDLIHVNVMVFAAKR